ncbi:MAG: DUF2130 domain-containing protein [Ignavibacteria bacterium]|jgi:hypothetical protein|nr:DUF2130 domain-containing protein [Ignavibacteria bacterium]
MQKKNIINCYNCNAEIDINSAIFTKLQEQFATEMQDKLKRSQKEIEEKAAFDLSQQAKKFEEEKKQFEMLGLEKEKQIKLEAEANLKTEKEKLEKSILENYECQIKALELENQKRKEENKSLKEKELAILQLEIQLKEKSEELQLTVEKKLLEKQKEIEDKAREKERANFELEKLQLLKQIEDNKKLAEEMKRKAEQGSMQLQGEVQEIALEELLSSSYPFDIIQEVPKGVRGADSIQIVRNELQQDCGSIVYESKRTKNFSNDWIDKLKQDQLSCKADLAVLVTQTLPNDVERFTFRDGIWICSFNEVKSLSFILRDSLIRIHSVKTAETNKGNKMELLYNYLTSNEFVQNIKRIVENYDGMLNQLNSEKKAMIKIWAQREKQIWVVQENLAALFGSIKGIAGKELENSKVLELPDLVFDEGEE